MIVRDDEKVKKIIAENIVRYRRECNLTQAELAEKIHYSDKSVSKWERAVPQKYTDLRKRHPLPLF